MFGKTADVVIIGGGVIGSAIAYYLARRKINVILLERKGIASGSSGACDGAVVMQTKKPGVHLRLALESHALLRRVRERLPVPIEYEETGGLIVVENETEIAVMQQFIEAQRQAGLEVALLDGRQLHDMVPCLSDHLIGAAFSPLARSIQWH